MLELFKGIKNTNGNGQPRSMHILISYVCISTYPHVHIHVCVSNINFVTECSFTLLYIHICICIQILFDWWTMVAMNTSMIVAHTDTLMSKSRGWQTMTDGPDLATLFAHD